MRAFTQIKTCVKKKKHIKKYDLHLYIDIHMYTAFTHVHPCAVTW